MAASFPTDALDPLVRRIGEVAGLFRPGADGAIEVNEDFFKDPITELGRAIADRQESIIELLGELMGRTSGEVVGLPAAGDVDQWIPIQGPDGDTGLYLVLCSKLGRLHFGLGWRWRVTADELASSMWAHVPLLSTDGTTTAGGTRVEVATRDAPLRLAADVSLRDGFGTAGLAFSGVRGSVSISGISEPPSVALVLLGLQLPGETTPRDRSLADLINLPGSAWIETAVALFTAQLSAAAGTDDTASRKVQAVLDHLLPLLGISAPAGSPRLRWEELPARGEAVFDDWFLALVNTPNAMRRWLGHWQGLLSEGLGTSIPAGVDIAVNGNGTRADPWHVGLSVGGVDTAATAAVDSPASGTRLLFLGLRVGATPIPLAGPLRLTVGGAAEVVAIPVGGSGQVRALPSLAIALKLHAQTGPLVSHTFGAGDPLAALAQLSVGSIEAGLGLDAAGKPVPLLQLREVSCARGSWPVLDLSSADAVIDGLGAVAGNAIQQLIEQGLGLLDGGTHAGRRVAALMGLVPPSSRAAPGAWPVPLLTDAAQISAFLGDPLGAIGRYHARCLLADVDGVPGWRHLLSELGELLRSAGGPSLPLRGSGSASDPWRLSLAATDAGAVVLRADSALVGGRPQLRLAAAFEPRALTVDAVQFSFAALAELLHLDLPAPANTGAPRATWLSGLRAELRLHGDLQTLPLADLRLSAEALSAAIEWRPTEGVGWRVALTAPGAQWNAASRAIALPDLVLDRDGIAGWTLDAPDLGGALDSARGAVSRDGVAELVQYLLGHLMLEHGGPMGFGLSALLGLLPGDPGIRLPAWRGEADGIALPADFPRLQPADWGAFFADPLPVLRGHVAAILSNPRHALPLLRWLGLALQGLAPARSRLGELLTFEEALGDLGGFPHPDAIETAAFGEALASPTATDDAPLALPSLEDLPFTLSGQGSYEAPYALGLRAKGVRSVQALVWLDPDGPPVGDAVDLAIATLVPALRDLGLLGSRPAEQLAPVLDVLAQLDAGMADALSGVLPARLGNGLRALEEFLRTSDGLVLSASQLPPVASGWSRPAQPLAADHVHALDQAAVVAEVRRQLLVWDAANTGPVLLLCAPFAGAEAWSTVQTDLGGARSAFSFRVAGVAPLAVSLASLDPGARLIAAELSAWNGAPGVAPAARAVPLDAPAGSSSQAEQVVRLLQRIAQLHPGQRVTVVAHSASGLAARAAVQRAGLAPLVRGLITVGTPHVGTPLPWLANAPLAEALSALQRLRTRLPLTGALGEALDALWGFLRERTPEGLAMAWPSQAFAPVGDEALPAGVSGHAVALRLPTASLASALASAVTTRATQLRAAMAARAPVSHLGVGLALAPSVRAAEGALKLRTHARLDIARVRIAAGDAARELPRLALQAEIWRESGWLVGDPAARVRVRRAELGCEITEAGIVPRVRLTDVSVDGVELPLATLRRLATSGPWVPDDLLVPALDALLAELTTGPGLDPGVLALARLLASVELTQLRQGGADDDSGGYAIHGDGWAAMLADAPAWWQRVLAAALVDVPRRDALVQRLRTVLGLAGDDLSRLLISQASDDPAWQALRALLQAVGLLASDARGAVPELAAWLALLRDPVAWATIRLRPLLADATRRGALLGRLRNLLGVRDLGSPVVELALGGGVAVRVEALGQVALRLDGGAFRLGGALSVSGDIGLNLASGSAAVALRLQPAAVATGLRLSLDLPVGAAGARWGLALDFSDGARGAPFAELPLVPLPADLPARLGQLLPRFTLTTLATSLLDNLLLPRVPQIAPVLQALGLATPVSATERARVRNLARVLADPLGWLRTGGNLFSLAGTGPVLVPENVVALVRQLFGTFGLTDAAGDVSLPLNLRLRMASAPQTRLSLATTAPMAFEGGVTLAGTLELAWSPAGSLGAGGSLALGAPLPAGSPWGQLVVQAGAVDGAFTLSLGPDGAPIRLLPFGGFDAASVGAAAERLLPTLIDGALRALADSGDAAVAAFITNLRAAAATLQVDSTAHLDRVAHHPVEWLRDRFSVVNAPASLNAVLNLIPVAVRGPFTVPAGALRFEPPGSPVSLSLGQFGAGGGANIGAAVELDIDLGPVTLSGALSVGLLASGIETLNLDPVVNVMFNAAVDPGVIQPGGVSIEPAIGLAVGASGVQLWLYPIGNVEGSPDFRLDVLPELDFGVDDGGSIEDALLELARRVLVPVAVEAVLDSDPVTGWLNTSITTSPLESLVPGTVLVSAGLLVVVEPPAGSRTAYNLAPLSSLGDPVRLVEGLIGAVFDAMATAFSALPIVAFDVPGSGIFLARDNTSLPHRFGLRVALPELRLGDDPEIIIRLGGETDWIAPAGGPAGVVPGLSLLLLTDAGAGSGVATRFGIEPVIELAGVGIDISGRADEPLFDLSGFQLGGLESLLYLRVQVPASGSAPVVTFGAYGDLDGIAIPLGTSNSNPVAASLMSGSGGESAPVNPRFSVRAAYVEDFWLELGDTPGRNEVWFPIQRTFGPVSIQQIGIRWIGGEDLKGAILLDGGVALAGLAVGVDDLSLTIPLAHIDDLSKWELGLRGLAVSYDGGGVRIGGGLLQVDVGPGQFQYDGFLLIEVGGYSFVALGSYGVINGEPSLFVFVVINATLGGPPMFFVTGLAGGFGYNRGLVVPAIDGLPQFPLIEAMGESSAVTATPMAFLQRMGPAVPMERGSYWFAAGVNFTSFALVKSQALLYVLLNRGLEIGLLGKSQFELPPAVPLVSVELALKARFSTIEGVVSVEARLTDNSWVLSRDCRLTGGFAFFLWFDGPYAGDFVITIGGYHPRYTPPAHYPSVPRLGFNWRVSSSIFIKGEAYFALTPREVMAGGLLEAVYDSGDVRAWFRAWANMYIQWRPFFFEVEIGISIGVAVDTWLGTVKVEVGASLIVWGPEIGGRVTIDIWIISITIPFGAARIIPQPPMSWDQFRASLLPPEDEKLFGGLVERGLASGDPATGPWDLLPEFVLRTETFLGASGVRVGNGSTVTTGPTETRSIDVKPMDVTGVDSLHRVRVLQIDVDVTDRFQVREAIGGNVPRALWDTEKAPGKEVIPAYTGLRLVAEIDRNALDSTGSVPWATLFEEGSTHPLPFGRELDLRATVLLAAQQALALDVRASHSSVTTWLAQDTVLHSAAWAERRNATLQALAAEGVRVTPSNRSGDVMPRGSFRRARRNAPPLVRSLHEGLAAEPVLSVQTSLIPPLAEATPVRVRARPELRAVIRQRVEPTKAGSGSVRTTVSSERKALRLSASQMDTLRAAPSPGASVKRQGSANEARATGLAMAAPTVMRASTATRREREWLDQMGAATLGKALRDGSAVRRDAAAPGAVLDPGSTLRFELPTRNVDGEPPVLVLSGDAAARVTALDRSGAPRLDVETVGSTKLAIPVGTAMLAVTGLGRSSQRPNAPALGAVSLGEATDAVPVVGWQAHNELVALTDNCLLARGALLRLGASVADLSQRGCVLASTALDRQSSLETLLPTSIRSLAVVLDEGAGEPGSDLASSLGLSVRHGAVSEEPTLIVAGGRTVLLYEVLKVEAQTPWLVVALAHTDAWSVAGVMGFAAPPSVWEPLLAEGELDALVEDGPLSASGSLRLQFIES